MIDIFTMSGSSSFSVSSTEQLGQWRSWIPGIPEHFDEFGKVLAIGDVDGDQCDDILVGVPREDIYSDTDAGMVHLFFGNSQSYYSFQSKAIQQPQSGIPGIGPGIADRYHRFGSGIAVGDFDGDSRCEISIGLPGVDVRNDMYGLRNMAEGAGKIQVYEVGSNRSVQFKQNWVQ